MAQAIRRKFLWEYFCSVYFYWLGAAALFTVDIIALIIIVIIVVAMACGFEPAVGLAFGFAAVLFPQL